MHEAFGIVLFVVVGVAAVIALVTAVGAGDAYRQIGRGGLSLPDREERLSDRSEPDAGGAPGTRPAPAPDGPTA
ncbi:MAG: hypothetical protein M3296_01270, partial [Actinomycetota bacterium]|nr:hypothetical protein [Actinomycetota bacterium]